jgi:hypothetical protein
MESARDRFLAFVSLFTSASTLICCALPALLVTLGMGAALASLTTAVPGLVTFTEYKGWVFSLGALLLALGGWMQWKARHAPCPVEPKATKTCMKLRRQGKVIYFVSLGLYATGFFFAFVAPRLLS